MPESFDGTPIFSYTLSVTQTKPTKSASQPSRGSDVSGTYDLERPVPDGDYGNGEPPRLRIERKASLLLEILGPALGVSFAFLLPLSLTAAYFALIPLILLWIAANARNLGSELSLASKMSAPFLFFIAAYVLSAPFGVDPIRSLRAIPPTLCFALTPFVVRYLALRSCANGLLIALMLGQAIAGVHSVLAAAFPVSVPPLFLGAVTESGQLGLVTIALAGLIFSGERGSAEGRSTDIAWQTLVASALCTTLLIVSSLIPLHVGRPPVIFWCSLLFGLSFAAWHLKLLVKECFASPLVSLLVNQRVSRLLLLGVLPLLLAALVINLKRGPWMGALIGGSIFLLGYRPKILLPLLGAILAAYFTLAPVRQRIAEIPEHFYISGGRSVMWDIGVELATRYPLGVGLQNSRFLQSFSPDIPRNMNHFHNNFINILVEGGWLALACFVWWLVNILRTAFQNFGPTANPVLAASIGAACISWQIAGLVEYNWGDSEVRILVYLLLGVLMSLVKTDKASERSHL